MKPAAISYIQKAERALAEARLLLREAATEGACRRAYYTMHDAAHAALIAVDDETAVAPIKTHQSLIAAFGRQLVQGGHVEASLGRTLNKVHDTRPLADYSAEPPSLADAEWAVEQAGQFVATMRETFFAAP